jgi:drug/metabolite transporter (DMT)-like permease
MLKVILWTIIFSVTGAGTTVLLGDRNLLSGNLLNWEKFISIILNWKFILAVILSFFARYSFMLVNSYLLKVPNLAQNSTTIAACITSIGFIFMIGANFVFLHERISFQQGFGAALILVGIWIVLK